LSHSGLTGDEHVDPALRDSAEHLAKAFHRGGDAGSGALAGIRRSRRSRLGRDGHRGPLTHHAGIADLEDVASSEQGLLLPAERSTHEPGPGGAPRVFEEDVASNVQTAVGPGHSRVADHLVAAVAPTQDQSPVLRKLEPPALPAGEAEEDRRTTGPSPL